MPNSKERPQLRSTGQRHSRRQQHRRRLQVQGHGLGTIQVRVQSNTKEDKKHTRRKRKHELPSVRYQHKRHGRGGIVYLRPYIHDEGRPIRKVIFLPIERVHPGTPHIGDESEGIRAPECAPSILVHGQMIPRTHTELLNITLAIEKHAGKGGGKTIGCYEVDEEGGPEANKRGHGIGPSAADDVDRSARRCTEPANLSNIQRIRSAERRGEGPGGVDEANRRVCFHSTDKGGVLVVGDVYVHIIGIPAIAFQEIVERKRAGYDGSVVAKGFAKGSDVGDERLHQLAETVAKDGVGYGKLRPGCHAPPKDSAKIRESKKDPSNVKREANMYGQTIDGNMTAIHTFFQE